MRASLRYVLPLAAFLLLGSLAFGQNVFNCSSNDMGYHTCRVGPNRGIRIVRQLSQNACIQGQTYGIARDGVWVDNGCRADFEVLQNGYYDNGQYSRQGVWNHRRDRDDDDADDNDQYPTAQYPNSPYNNGPYYNGPYNNGPYNNGAYNNGPYYDPYNRGYVNNGQAIQYMGRYDDGKSTCSSQPGVGPIYCKSGGPFRDAYLIKQNGQTQCVRNQNWGVDPNHGLWIADGCSGEFKIEK